MPWWAWFAFAAAGLFAWGLIRPRPEHRRAEATPPLQDYTPAIATSVTIERRVFAGDEADDVDDDYDQFVASSWASATMPMGAKNMAVNGRACIVHSLTPAPDRAAYVNLTFPGSPRKCSFAGDDRHRWSIEGQRVSPAIFRAICEGSATADDIRPDDHPATLEDALAADRFPTTQRRMALQYASADGVVGWRVISRLQRGPDCLYAVCHLRWGDSRTFRYDRILTLLDIDTGERIDLPPTSPAGSTSRRGSGSPGPSAKQYATD